MKNSEGARIRRNTAKAPELDEKQWRCQN